MPYFIDQTGARQEVNFTPTLYREAADKKLTVRQLINQKYPTTADAGADTFTQMCASENLLFDTDRQFGVSGLPLSEILSPAGGIEAGGNVTRETPVQSRILFPAAILAVIEDKLAVDRDSAVAVFDQMVAISSTVSGSRVEQPVISYEGKDGPEDSRAQRIAQLAEPQNMMLITASETTRQIPTFSIGLLVSDEVRKYTTLPLVALSLQRQLEIEFYSLAGEAMLAMLNGDLDNGQSALSTVKANTFDSSITNAGELTHKAWVKWLYSDLQKRRIDWVVCDLDAALAIENRTGKPVITGDDPNSPRIDTLFNIAYPNLIKNVRMYIVPDDWGWPANTIMGLQSNVAIAKLINMEAEYQATERFALRRGDGLRFDFGEMYYRLFDDAFSVLSLTV